MESNQSHSLHTVNLHYIENSFQIYTFLNCQPTMTFGQLQKVIHEHINVSVKDQVLLKPESGYQKLVNIDSTDDHVFAQNIGFRSQSQT